jgi:hypothetical protein
MEIRPADWNCAPYYLLYEALACQRCNFFGKFSAEPKYTSMASLKSLCLFVRGTGLMKQCWKEYLGLHNKPKAAVHLPTGLWRRRRRTHSLLAYKSHSVARHTGKCNATCARNKVMAFPQLFLQNSQISGQNCLHVCYTEFHQNRSRTMEGKRANPITPSPPK